MLDLFSLKGKVALFTGGNRGLGKAMAIGLAKAGADVAVVGRKLDQDVIDQIQAAAVKAQADADYKTKLEGQGFDVPQENGEAFAATIAAETARWAQVVKATGFKANE